MSDDWRVTEGPAIGTEPLFALSDIEVRALFSVTGWMGRRVEGRLTTETPTLLTSSGRRLPDLIGALRIFDQQAERSTVGHAHQRYGADLALNGARGVLAVFDGRYAVDLYLPPDQFDALLPLLRPAPVTARLWIEIERTLAQGLVDADKLFWDDRRDPVIAFNEFEISVA